MRQLEANNMLINLTVIAWCKDSEDEMWAVELEQSTNMFVSSVYHNLRSLASSDSHIAQAII